MRFSFRDLPLRYKIQIPFLMIFILFAFLFVYGSSRLTGEAEKLHLLINAHQKRIMELYHSGEKLEEIMEKIEAEHEKLKITSQKYQKELGAVVSVNIVSAILGLAIVLLVAYSLSALIARRLDRLLSATIEIMRGDLKVKIPEESKDEIGILAQSFNQMAGKLKESTEGLERKVAERTAELEKAHQANLNIIENFQDSQI